MDRRWVELGRIPGLAMFCAFDVDNDSADPLHVQLVRDSGAVLVDLVIGPRHAHPPYSLNNPTSPPRWLWETLPGDEIVIPAGSSVLIRADRLTTAYANSYVP